MGSVYAGEGGHIDTWVAELHVKWNSFLKTHPHPNLCYPLVGLVLPLIKTSLELPCGAAFLGRNPLSCWWIWCLGKNQDSSSLVSEAEGEAGPSKVRCGHEVVRVVPWHVGNQFL